eukprot:2543893-Rhodomonas_salina.1
MVGRKGGKAEILTHIVHSGSATLARLRRRSSLLIRAGVPITGEGSLQPLQIGHAMSHRLRGLYVGTENAVLVPNGRRLCHLVVDVALRSAWLRWWRSCAVMRPELTLFMPVLTLRACQALYSDVAYAWKGDVQESITVEGIRVACAREISTRCHSRARSTPLSRPQVTGT